VSIVLHIERLVIDEAVLGHEPAGRVRAALEGELGRLLAQPGAVAALRRIGTVAVLPPATLPAAAHSSETFGMRVAAAVQHGLGLRAATHDGSTTRHG
jgi:hypothetical protein